MTSPQTIRNRLAAATEKAGIPFYGLHALRHTNASIMLSLNTPDKYAMERGGWSSDKTMKQTYQHTMSETRKKIDANIDAYFDSIMNPKKRLRWRIKKTNITTLLSKCQKNPDFMTNFMTKMQLRNLFLRSRQCSGHHKNDTHETPETLDTQRKNLQSIGLTVIRN